MEPGALAVAVEQLVHEAGELAAGLAVERHPVVGETPLVTACACASCWCAPPADTPEAEDHDVGDVNIPVLAGVS